MQLEMDQMGLGYFDLWPWHSGENDHRLCNFGLHYFRSQREMGQNIYGVVRAYAIMVYGHAQSYSTIDGQLGSGQNWDAKEIASFSATNNTSLVPWLLDVFVSTLIPFSNLPEIARNDPAGLTSSIPHKFPDILHSVYPGVPFNSPGGFGTDFGSFWAPDVSSVLGTPGLAM